ncbi:MAG: ROK family protein [Geitlerinemataceae cyanobacterium]
MTAPAPDRFQTTIGIDLGGTSIGLGCFDRDGHCTASASVPTPQPATPEAVTGAIAAAIEDIDPDRQCGAIGVGTPGPVDATERVALVAINLAGWQDVPLAANIEARCGRPVVLGNDANCAGLGEAWLGAARWAKNSIVLTLGTGVGGAIVLGGQLFSGHRGAAGELGLISIDPDGPECNSGNRGSLEQFCSVQAIRRDCGCEPLELAERAEAGDAEAIAYWERYGRYLGIGIANLLYVLTPEIVVLGGGISAGIDLFLPSAMAEIDARVLPTSRVGLTVRCAELGNRAGAIGAARLAWQRFGAVE